MQKKEVAMHLFSLSQPKERLQAVFWIVGSFRQWQMKKSAMLNQKHVLLVKSTDTSIKVVGTPKMDQKVCLNMVKKDQLCAIALKKRN